MDDVAGDEEGVCVGSAESRAGFAARGEFFGYALHDDGEEIAAGALAEEGADFFVVEQSNQADLGGAGEGGGRVEEGLDGGP